MQSTQLQKDRYKAKTLQELEAVAIKHGITNPKGWAWHTHLARLKPKK